MEAGFGSRMTRALDEAQILYVHTWAPLDGGGGRQGVRIILYQTDWTT